MTSFSTPIISHLNDDTLKEVYEPAEDSFLMLDALEKDYNFLIKSRPSLCLEVGSGSGIVSTFAAKILQNGCHFMCTDINKKAAETSAVTASKNNVTVDPIVGDLASPLLPRLKGKVDLLLFNPPYVVTPDSEVGSKGIEASWAGGTNGRQVIDRFLPLVTQLLSKSGALYLLLLKENKPDEICDILAAGDLQACTILSRRTGPELLYVVRFTHKDTDS